MADQDGANGTEETPTPDIIATENNDPGRTSGGTSEGLRASSAVSRDEKTALESFEAVPSGESKESNAKVFFVSFQGVS